MYSTLFTLNTTTEVPLSKTPNTQLLPGHRSINSCPLLWVCVCPDVCALGWVLSISHHTWSYVTSLSFLKLKKGVCVYNSSSSLYLQLSLAHFESLSMNILQLITYLNQNHKYLHTFHVHSLTKVLCFSEKHFVHSQMYSFTCKCIDFL